MSINLTISFTINKKTRLRVKSNTETFDAFHEIHVNVTKKNKIFIKLLLFNHKKQAIFKSIIDINHNKTHCKECTTKIKKQTKGVILMNLTKKNLTLVSAFLLTLTLALPSFAFSPPPATDPGETVIDDQCYSGSALDSVPYLSKPSEESWRHWSSRLLTGSPYHMIHDGLFSSSQTQTIVGKFDYGSTFHKDLEDEDVLVYIYGTGIDSWEYVGRYRTNSDGKVYVNIPQKGVGEYIIKMIVAGDLTEAVGYMNVVEAGRKTVLFDIDGTLTKNDFQVVEDYAGVGNATAYSSSKQVVDLYKQKGYQIIYLTARPYWVARDTREWLSDKGYPTSITRFSTTNGTITDPLAYKTEFLQYMINDLDLDLIRVYGNAGTDIQAYEAAGIPKENTYIIGDEAGNEGTQPLYDSYDDHFSWLEEIITCANN